MSHANIMSVCAKSHNSIVLSHVKTETQMDMKNTCICNKLDTLWLYCVKSYYDLKSCTAVAIVSSIQANFNE